MLTQTGARGIRETSLATMVLERAERYGLKRVLLSKQNGCWGEISWQTLGSKITRAARQTLPFCLGAQHRLADRLVFSKLRELLGGHIRFLVSGWAPLSFEIARFFYGAGIIVYEGYGLTEAGPIVSCNLPGRTRLGTVGPALPQVKVKTAADGEICVHGPNVMLGYYLRPEDTAQAIDAEGWLHTGDQGMYPPGSAPLYEHT